ncbi:MAG TPA: sigma 54-interacting transcriptional regulator [Polyangia bacterium]|jgi:transcriptional regulator with PAS, ATPase and Fis domain
MMMNAACTLEDDATGIQIPPALKLVVLSGPDAGRQLKLDEGQRYVIGSAHDRALDLHDPKVSRRHLELEVLGDGVRVTDLESKNGSFHEGARFREIYIGTGAIIRVGDSELQLVCGERGVPLPASDSDRFGGLIGRSLMMRQLFTVLARAAASDTAILVNGETGTGKEVCAEAIHARSPRARGPFIVFDCAAIPATLIESELFGHARGAFTGAHNARDGAFVQAHGGTLFIDEVGELPLELQPRLLRAIDRQQVKPLGASGYREVDVRVVAATHRDLPDEVAHKRFREDLFHRLSVLQVTLPPLRRRKDDIPMLVRELIGPDGPMVSPASIALLVEHDWPGNVRELRNVLERARSLTHKDHALTPTELGFDAAADVETPDGFHAAKERLIATWERGWVAELLKRAGGNVSKAARAGQLDRVSLHRLMKKHGIPARD